MFIDELILKQLSILLLSAVKFLLAAPASHLFGYSYLHTILNTTVGGWIGVIFFLYAGKHLFARYPQWKYQVVRLYDNLSGINRKNKLLSLKNTTGKPAKIFTRRNRIIVIIRKRFGFPGLIVLTPVLFSIPIGTFLVVKYYSKRRDLLAWLSLSVMIWSVVLSTFIQIF
jgi:hypothetical protein